MAQSLGEPPSVGHLELPAPHQPGPWIEWGIYVVMAVAAAGEAGAVGVEGAAEAEPAVVVAVALPAPQAAC